MVLAQRLPTLMVMKTSSAAPIMSGSSIPAGTDLKFSCEFAALSAAPLAKEIAVCLATLRVENEDGSLLKIVSLFQSDVKPSSI